MTSQTYWIPAESQEGATRLAHAIHAKRLPMRSYFANEEAANAWAAECNKFLRHPVRVYAVVIETRTTHDGRIPVARIIDGAGSVAAALMLVIGGAYAVGFGSML